MERCKIKCKFVKYDSIPVSQSERRFMKSKKAIGLTLLSAFLISGCANANVKTTSFKDSTKSDYVSSQTTSDVSSSETEISSSTTDVSSSGTEISSSTTDYTEPAESKYYKYSQLPDGTYAIAVGTNTNLESLTIPRMHNGKMVTQIADHSFSGCKNLKQINLPDTIKMIGLGAFLRCSSLNSINIPESVTSIGNNAFQYCSSLTSINIPDSVTSIDNGAFLGCSKLTSINIPNSVTSIDESAFEGCSSLTIYCAAESKPAGWNDNWNSSQRPVEWNCKSKQ